MHQITVGIIPVGGKGTRLSKHNTLQAPKVLFQLNGIEILRYPLLSLKYAGCKRVICVTSDTTHDQIARFLEATALDIDLRAVNARAEGTAEALVFLSKSVSEPFFYTNGDIIFHPNILLDLRNQYESGDFIATVSASTKNVAPTHPHFTCDDLGSLRQVMLWPYTSSESLCSLETAVFRPEVFAYAQRLPRGALTMEALALAKENGGNVSVLRTDQAWYHLAEPSDIDKFTEFKAIAEIEQLLGGRKFFSPELT